MLGNRAMLFLYKHVRTVVREKAHMSMLQGLRQGPAKTNQPSQKQLTPFHATHFPYSNDSAPFNLIPLGLFSNILTYTDKQTEAKSDFLFILKPIGNWRGKIPLPLAMEAAQVCRDLPIADCSLSSSNSTFQSTWERLALGTLTKNHSTPGLNAMVLNLLKTADPFLILNIVGGGAGPSDDPAGQCEGRGFYKWKQRLYIPTVLLVSTSCLAPLACALNPFAALFKGTEAKWRHYLKYLSTFPSAHTWKCREGLGRRGVRRQGPTDLLA